jgi:hypothetical protein
MESGGDDAFRWLSLHRLSGEAFGAAVKVSGLHARSCVQRDTWDSAFAEAAWLEPTEAPACLILLCIAPIAVEPLGRSVA